MTFRKAAAPLGALAFFAANPAAAEPMRLLVSVGSQRGLPAEVPLRFAQADARRVRDVMVAQGGVRSEDAVVLAEPSHAELLAALDMVRAKASKANANEVTLVFYFSGHGDREALHVAGERVALSELESKIAAVPARLRIVVTDACRATRDKGFQLDPGFPILVTTLPQATGSVWLHASSDGEAAQESDDIGGAIFTHAWLSGLRGAADANGDARVTLEESFAFAHSQTLMRSAKSSGVLQKPEAVMNLREAAPVVLTQTTSELAKLTLPASKDTHFLVYASGAKSVMAELWAQPTRPTQLALPPGGYVVQRRFASSGAVAQVSLAHHEVRAVEERDFVTAPLDVLAQKGGAWGVDAPSENEDPGRPKKPLRHELWAGYDLGASTRSPLLHGPRAGYAYLVPWGALAAGASLEFANNDAVANPERLTTGWLHLGVEPRLGLGLLTLRAGAGLRVGLVAQSIDRRQPAVSTAEGPVVTEHHMAMAFGPELNAGMRLRSRARPEGTWFADLGGTARLVWLNQSERLTSVLGATGLASAGLDF